MLTLGDIISYARIYVDRADISYDDLGDVIDSVIDLYLSIHIGTDSEEAEYDDLIDRLEQRLYHSHEWEQNEVPVNTPNQTDDESGDPE